MVAAKRYARAVLELARESGELDKWRQELEKLSVLLQEPGLPALLRSPKLPFGHKKKVLDERLKGLSPLTLNLAGLLVLRGRLGLLNSLVKEYGRLVDAHYGIEHIEVTTAVPLGQSDLQQVSGRLAAALGKKVILESRVEPALLGGLVVRVGDHLIDGSVRKRLELLGKGLAGARS
ncbi:MAG: atpH [Dehalococcoidia bacterium]|nr:atpH [Dehalococcoidia bacterium]